MSNGRNVSSLSEFRFTTTLLVIPMDMDGLHWIPSDEWISMESIGQHFYPPQYLTSGTLSRRDFRLSNFHRRVSRIEFCLFHRKTKFSIGTISEYWTYMEGGIKENLTII